MRASHISQQGVERPKKHVIEDFRFTVTGEVPVSNDGFRRDYRAAAYVPTSGQSLPIFPRPRPLTPVRRSDPRGDARRQTPAGIPRQLRAPLDPSQQVPEGYVVRPLEVHGKHFPLPIAQAQVPSRRGYTEDAQRVGLFPGYSRDTMLTPRGNCQDERHSYEKCQYVEFKKRVAKMDELRESKGGARSN
ncbi:hypothetical protein NM208_g9031 [Fusarium decemcellulare]|uniref:Uncharacterized protein n=1 Tax=Fusarium decemcellulare TaxID=57161 RepID=A0ACC1S3A4_9HYPO|nr:hypothetical protein NM208_g9031 [Fusarium decemcellulare]